MNWTRCLVPAGRQRVSACHSLLSFDLFFNLLLPAAQLVQLGTDIVPKEVIAL